MRRATPPAFRLPRLLAVLLGLLIGFAAPQASAQRKRGTPAARRYSTLKNLKDAAKKNPQLRSKMRRVVDERLRTIDSTRTKPSRIRDRRAWLPLGSDPALRRVTVSTVLRKMNQASRRLKQQIRQRPDEALWDVVFVGAGVHSAISANALAEADQDIRMLTVEATNVVASTFRGIGDTIARNSANRQSVDGQAIERGRGDKNPSLGPWGDPDLAGGEWPAVQGFADVATVNLYASGSDFLMQTRVRAIRERQAGDNFDARYRVEMDDGTVVFTNQVVVGTGLGKPKIPDLGGGNNLSGNTLVDRVRSEIDYERPDEVPGILTAEEALRLANLSYAGRDPYRSRLIEASNGRGSSPRTVTEVSGGEGTRLDVSVPTIFIGRGTDGLDPQFSVDAGDVASFEPDGGNYTVRLADGTERRVAGLGVSVAGRFLPLRNERNLEELAERLNQIELPVSGRIEARLANRSEVRTERRIAIGRDLPRTAETRVDFIRKSTPSPLFSYRAQNRDNNLNISDVADVTSDGTAFTIRLKTGATIEAQSINAGGTLSPLDARFLAAEAANGEFISFADIRRSQEQVLIAAVFGTADNNLQNRVEALTGVTLRGQERAFRLDEIEEISVGSLPDGDTIVDVRTVEGKTALRADGLGVEGRIDGQRQQRTLTVDQARLLSLPKVRPPRPEIAVIGGGDSARTFLEYLYGQAPEAAYTGPGKNDTAQRGDVGNVTWIVGRNGPADCNQFLQSTRSRYLRLAGKVREVAETTPLAQLAQARLTGIEEITSGPDAGRYRLTYQDGRNRVTERVVDRVIFATGYDNQALDLFEGGRDGTRLTDIRDSLDNLPGPRTLGRRVEGQDIFLVGPAANVGGAIIDPDETFNTRDNEAAIFAFRNRDAKLMKKYVARGPKAIRPFESGSLYKVRDRPVLRPTPDSVSSVRGPLRRNANDLAIVPKTTLGDVVFRSELADVLEDFRYPGTDGLELNFRRDGESVVISGNIDSNGLAAIRDRLLESPLFVDEMRRFDEDFAVTVYVEVRDGKAEETQGLVRVRTMELRY